MAEKVDLKEFAKGFATPASWWKAVGIGLKILALVLVAFAIYKAFVAKPKPTQDITVESGGVVTIKNEAQKKNWYIFTEPYVGVDTQNKGYIGIRCGVRWEF